MKLFLSWSGDRSKALAEALHDWIPLVLHYVEPWLSQADIEAGQRWAEQVAKQLDSSNFGITCVTRENASSPWVLFEAGALAKSMQGSRVIPMLLDLEFREITGPLAQFQAKKVDKGGVFDVIQSLNQQVSEPEHPVPEERVRQLFDALWPELEKKVGAIPKVVAPTKHVRPQPEILEELVTGVRTLDLRFREIAQMGPGVSRRRRFFSPGLISEFSRVSDGKNKGPIFLLWLASMFRDEVPILYELGMEAYRNSRNGTPEESIDTIKRFRTAISFFEPLFEDNPSFTPMIKRFIFEFDRQFEIGIPEETEPSNPPPPKAIKRRKIEKPE